MSKSKTQTPETSIHSDQNPEITYWTDTTEGSTFESDKLRWWTESKLGGVDQMLNPCAGEVALNVDGETLRVDINEDANADLHIDFRNLLEHVEENSFDAIVYDPPYTWNQAVNKYGLDIDPDGFYFYDDEIKVLFDTLLAPGGTFIQFGYSTDVMPDRLGYETTAIGIFNKLGCQNDYFGVAAQKPVGSQQPEQPFKISKRTLPNEEANKIEAGDISTGGNGGQEINTVYKKSGTDTDYKSELSILANEWTEYDDRVLHIYEEEPRIERHTDEWTTCAYYSPDLQNGVTEETADIVETPWNIGSRFATGVFDVVILDLPYSAWQQNIRTPHEQASEGSDKTHVDTAIKRSITDIVKGKTGKVIQIGRTATTMSGDDYNYSRTGVGILQHPSKNTDRIISVDTKGHENLEVAGLGEGEVDGEYSFNRGAPNITDKRNRTDHPVSHYATFCVHCGNSFFHHPAAYLWCPDCNATEGDMCRSEDGSFNYPSGPHHSITLDDVCDARIEQFKQYHDGSCNNKDRTHLTSPIEKPKTESESNGNTTDTKPTNADQSNLTSFV